MKAEEIHFLAKGQVVAVSDGTPMPPKHHTRKLSRWQSRNYRGYVDKVDNIGGMRPSVGVDSSGTGIMVIMEPAANVIPIEQHFELEYVTATRYCIPQTFRCMARHAKDAEDQLRKTVADFTSCEVVRPR